MSSTVWITAAGHGHRVVIDARAGGLLVAGVALALRAPLVLAVLCAATATALLRAPG